MSVARNHVGTRFTQVGPDVALLAALAAAGVVAAACAGRQHVANPNQAPPHAIEVQVDNDKLSPDEQPTRRPSQTGVASGPVEIRVFVTQDGGGLRQYIGTVAGGQQQTFKFTPTSYGNWYRLVGITPLGTSVESSRFNIVSPQTGLVEWSLQTGMINYYDLAPDTTKAAPPATPPTTSPNGQAPSTPPSSPPSNSPNNPGRR